MPHSGSVSGSECYSPQKLVGRRQPDNIPSQNKWTGNVAALKLPYYRILINISYVLNEIIPSCWRWYPHREPRQSHHRRWCHKIESRVHTIGANLISSKSDGREESVSRDISDENSDQPIRGWEIPHHEKSIVSDCIGWRFSVRCSYSPVNPVVRRKVGVGYVSHECRITTNELLTISSNINAIDNQRYRIGVYPHSIVKQSDDYIGPWIYTHRAKRWIRGNDTRRNCVYNMFVDEKLFPYRNIHK